MASHPTSRPQTTTMEEASADYVGVPSILDTDLYKLTMQCAVLKNFPDASEYLGFESEEVPGLTEAPDVTYELTNRTPEMRLTRKAYNWCRDQILGMSNAPHRAPLWWGEILPSDC